MPANKYASVYLNGAYERLLHAVSEMRPPAFGMFPLPEDFENAKDSLESLARAVDDYVFAVANDADGNAPINIDTKDRIALLGNALSECDLLSDLDEAADQIREDQREEQLERAS